MQQLLQEREAERERDAIQNEMYLNKQKALTDAQHYQYSPAKHISLHDTPTWRRVCGHKNTGDGSLRYIHIGLLRSQRAHS